MAIMVKATGGGGDFVPCPAGTHLAVCCDVADLGLVENKKFGKIEHKIRLHWQINKRMPDGKPFVATRRYTASLHEKASLRKDLEAWRGRPFNQAELDGFDLERLIGVSCMLQVMHQPNEKGGVFANVVAVMQPLEAENGKPMRLEVDPDYKRVKDRAETQAATASQDVAADDVPPHDDDDAPVNDDDDDSVPF